MAIERKLDKIEPVTFTSDGTSGGVVTISDTKGFRVKAYVVLSANTLPALQLEVKRVLSKTQLRVGPKGSIDLKSDISAYTVSLNSTISQPEQDRPGVPTEQHERAVFAEEPILAKRNILVDEYGNYYGPSNPFPMSITNDLNSFVPDDYDDVQLEYDSSNNLTQASFYLNNNLITEISLSYDINNNLIQAQRTV